MEMNKPLRKFEVKELPAPTIALKQGCMNVSVNLSASKDECVSESNTRQRDILAKHKVMK